MTNVTAKVTVDASQVQEDLSSLQYQLEELSNTVQRLNENGLNIKIKMKVDSDTFFRRIFKQK